MLTFALDFSRVCLLLWRCVQWGAPLVVRLLPGLPPGGFSPGYRLRRIIEGMGASYVKLGQYFAIRYDLLPASVCRELSNLLNEVPPVEFNTVRQIIEAELGGCLGDSFLSFEPQPVGSASIAQVHRAVSRDGQRLAVKVQRPRVEDYLRSDLRNMIRIAKIADRFRLMGAISLAEVVQEVADFTLREVDFIQEGQMADQLREGAPSYVKVPEIRWDLTTRRVLSMEFIDGISLLSICEEAETSGNDAFQQLLPRVDAEQLVTRLAHACLRQLFVTGVFHGDPHPANVIVRNDGTISFIDFGIFGRLTTDQRVRLAELMYAMAVGRHERAYRCYLGLATVTEDTDLYQYRQDMIATLRRWHEVVSNPAMETSEKLAASFQTQVMQLMRRHRVRPQPDQILVWRALSLLDATAHRLPGGFDMLAVMESFFESTRLNASERLTHLATDGSRIAGLVSVFEQSTPLARRLLARGGRAVAGGNGPIHQLIAVRRVSDAAGVKHIVGLLVAGSLAALIGSFAGASVFPFLAVGACALLFGAALFDERRRAVQRPLDRK